MTVLDFDEFCEMIGHDLAECEDEYLMDAYTGYLAECDNLAYETYKDELMFGDSL